MIDWTADLLGQIDSFSRAALSYVGRDGYPVTLPLPFSFDRTEHRYTLPAPRHPPASSAHSESQTSLTLLRYDPQVANERYVLFYGQLAQHGDAWTFTPTRVVLPASSGWRERQSQSR